MKKMEFVEFCKRKIEQWEQEILKIEEEIKNLPQPEEINVAEYSKNGKWLTLYKSKTKQPFLKRIFGPSKKELSDFIYQTEKRSLEVTKNLLMKKKDQLQTAIATIEGDTFTVEIFPNTQIIDTILEYGEMENSSAKEILDLLLSLLNQTTKKAAIESHLEVNIASSFDKHNYPKKERNPDDIIFMINKLLTTIFGSEYLDRYTITRNGIKNEILLRYQKVNSVEGRKEILLEEQKAIEELQQYIVGTEVVAPTKTVSEFKKLLHKAGLPTTQIKEYASKMKQKIKEAEAIRRKQEDEEALATYLTQEQLEVYKEAISLVNRSNSEELDSLLSRSIKDVVSLCRYLRLLEPNMSEVPETYEKIGEKIGILNTEIAKIKHPSAKKARFNYLISSEGIPILLRNIEVLDNILYFETYNLLSRLSLNPQNGKKCKQIDGIDICIIEGSDITIRYAQRSDAIVIINLYNTNHGTPSELTNADIESIKHILENENNADQISFQKTCEDLILQALNLNAMENTYTLQKQKKNEKRAT